MAKSNDYENTIEPEYPPGSTYAKYIDDIFRQVKAAFASRLDQEHFWRAPSDADYDVAAEGAHRTEAARVHTFGVTTQDPNIISVNSDPASPPYLPDKANHLDGMLLAAEGSGEVGGSVWKAVGGVLKGLIKRLRGKVIVNGRMYFAQAKFLLHNVPAGTTGWKFDEQDYAAQASSITVDRDNITLVPYHTPVTTDEVDSQKTWEEVQNDIPRDRILYPIRVGKWDPQNETFSQDSTKVEGVEFIFGTGSSERRVVLTKLGVEVYGDSDLPVLYNGVDVRKHDHSGKPGMGAKLNLLDLIPELPTQRITAVLGPFVKQAAGSLNITKDAWVSLTFPASEIFPAGEDWSKYTYIAKLSYRVVRNDPNDWNERYFVLALGKEGATMPDYSVFRTVPGVTFWAITAKPSDFGNVGMPAMWVIPPNYLTNEQGQVTGLQAYIRKVSDTASSVTLSIELVLLAFKV